MMQITSGGVMASTGEWTGSFVRSALAPSVFVVAPEARAAVRAWAVAQRCAAATSREPHRPVLDAWAVLDGGILAVASWQPDPGALVAGLYVVGFGAFRLVTAELGPAGPTRPVPGEPLYDLAALRAAHSALTARPVTCPDAREQAELLATCDDARSLRRVATALASTARSHTLAG
jgi:hypothetical protein